MKLQKIELNIAQKKTLLFKKILNFPTVSALASPFIKFISLLRQEKEIRYLQFWVACYFSWILGFQLQLLNLHFLLCLPMQLVITIIVDAIAAAAAAG